MRFPLAAAAAAVALDEVLLEMERLDLGPRDDHLDAGRALDELRDPGARVAAPRLEVGTDPRAQRFRLPDVEDVGTLAAKEVHTRLRRKSLQRITNV